MAQAASDETSWRDGASGVIQITDSDDEPSETPRPAPQRSEPRARPAEVPDLLDQMAAEPAAEADMDEEVVVLCSHPRRARMEEMAFLLSENSFCLFRQKKRGFKSVAERGRAPMRS